MNISLDDKKIINAAVDYTINHHIKGTPKSAEETTRRSAIAAKENIRKDHPLSAEEVRALYVSLTFYAKETSKNVLFTDRETIERAYDLADEFYDYLIDAGLVD